VEAVGPARLGGGGAIGPGIVALVPETGGRPDRTDRWPVAVTRLYWEPLGGSWRVG
jgi:hypothetical protein